jgi:hypothetical protein
VGGQPASNALRRVVETWSTDGYVIFSRYLPDEVNASAVAELSLEFPTADEFHDSRRSERNAPYRREFGGIRVFPFLSVELSLLAVHPRLVELAEAILWNDDIRIYASELWAKFTGAAQFDQELHRDYLNHTPLVPSANPGLPRHSKKVSIRLPGRAKVGSGCACGCPRSGSGRHLAVALDSIRRGVRMRRCDGES